MIATFELRQMWSKGGLWSVIIISLLLVGLGNCSAKENTTSCSSFAPPATLKGRKFFDSVSGKYIPIKGIAYYPRPNAGNLITTDSVDFIAEEHRATWERDVAYFQQLNINLVRIYAVDPSRNHDGFMCALRVAGIYAIIELTAGCQNCTITPQSAPDCYPAALKMRGQFIISEFARYDNVLAFSAGNKVSLGTSALTVNGPCQKQFLRDMRAYIQDCNSTVRHIPVGLSFADAHRQSNALWYG